MAEIVPITPQHVLGHLRMAGATSASAYKSSQAGIPRNRRLPGGSSHSPGWVTTAVDRNGNSALKVGGRVITPAEGVLLRYNTNGYAHHAERAAEETPRVLDHLRSQGLTVNPGTIYPNSYVITRMY